MKPVVSIIMPVLNSEGTVQEAVSSLLSQTLTNFELIIIDDNSSDQSFHVLSSIIDRRICIYQNKKKLGIPKTLNRGISVARGEFIARADADDINSVNRLQKQVNFLTNNPRVGLVGSSFEAFGDKKYIKKFPLSHDEITSRLLFRSALAHPSVMFRKSSMRKHRLKYDENFERAQDFDLWERSSHKFLLANLPDVLISHRVHKNQASTNSKIDKTIFAKKVLLRQLKNNLHLNPTPDETSLHWKIGSGSFEKTQAFLNASRHWLLQLKQANYKVHYYNEKVFNNELENLWRSMTLNSRPIGFATLSRLFLKTQL